MLTSLKVQVLANFLAETSFSKDEDLTILPYEEKPPQQDPKSWIMMMDWDVNVRELIVRIRLESLSESYFEVRSIRLDFLVSNN